MLAERHLSGASFAAMAGEENATQVNAVKRGAIAIPKKKEKRWLRALKPTPQEAEELQAFLKKYRADAITQAAPELVEQRTAIRELLSFALGFRDKAIQAGIELDEDALERLQILKKRWL